MLDNLADLPTDEIQPGKDELIIVDKLFNSHESTFHKLLREFKEPMILAILFIILSLPLINNFLGIIIPSAQNSLIIQICIKTLIFIVAYYLLKNFSFIQLKKNN
jgi:hypothetical protein